MDHGADPNLPEFPSQRELGCIQMLILFTELHIFLESCSDYPIAGLMQGLTSYTPLHIVCARTDPAAAKVRQHILSLSILQLYIL